MNDLLVLVAAGVILAAIYATALIRYRRRMAASAQEWDAWRDQTENEEWHA